MVYNLAIKTDSFSLEYSKYIAQALSWLLHNEDSTAFSSKFVSKLPPLKQSLIFL